MIASLHDRTMTDDRKNARSPIVNQILTMT